MTPDGRHILGNDPSAKSNTINTTMQKPATEDRCFGQEENNENDVLKPASIPERVCLGMNQSSGKLVFRGISKSDIWNARMYLKYYGLRSFLNVYLPETVTPMHLYYSIKLLGFELKDATLAHLMSDQMEIIADDAVLNLSPIEITTNIDKKQTIRLIKDLQKAVNKVLSTRTKLPNFSTIDDFVMRLRTAKNIIVLTGAGISTSLGIPDFRSSQGFYNQITNLGLSDPQDVFNLETFKRDPSIFYSIAHMVLPPENTYSPMHSFIKLLHDKGKLLRNYSQNIDNLESYAGIPSDKLIQCHGSFGTATCITCKWSVPGEAIFANIRNSELPLCPHCYNKRKVLLKEISVSRSQMQNGSRDNSSARLNDLNTTYAKESNKRDIMNSSSVSAREEQITHARSYGIIKPDITFFGEPLPSKFHDMIKLDVLKCDLLICVGTSLKVAPVSEIINMVPAHVPQVLINKDPVHHAEFDIRLLGKCDEVVTEVCRQCDWDIPHDNWLELKKLKFNIEHYNPGVYTFEKL